jgi:hypothetical protein
MKFALSSPLNRIWRLEMVKLGNTSPNALLDELEKRELLEMLQVVIAEGGGLATIRLILDEAKTMPDIRARFAAWQSTRRTTLNATTTSSQPMPPTTDSAKAAKFAH